MKNVTTNGHFYNICRKNVIYLEIQLQLLCLKNASLKSRVALYEFLHFFPNIKQ